MLRRLFSSLYRAACGRCARFSSRTHNKDPARGAASRVRIGNRKALEGAVQSVKRASLQQLVDGQVFTIDTGTKDATMASTTRCFLRRTFKRSLRNCKRAHALLASWSYCRDVDTSAMHCRNSQFPRSECLAEAFELQLQANCLKHLKGRSSLVVTALSLVDSGDNWTLVRTPSPPGQLSPFIRSGIDKIRTSPTGK